MPLLPLLVFALVFLLAAVVWRLYRMNEDLFRSLLVIAVLILVTGVAVLYFATSLEVVSSIEVLNRGGERGTALVVYHPGLTGFHEKVTSAFAGGLVSNGWRVEMTTASSQAPADLSSYDLLVLADPAYPWTPNLPIKRYLSRLGDLGGQNTAIIVTAIGMGGPSISAVDRLVRAANGDLVQSLLLHSLAPNEEIYGASEPEEIAYQLAKAITLPGE
jgi:hypothetical protein